MTERFWNLKTYYMCQGAIWGACLTLIALRLIPHLKSLLGAVA